MNPKLYNRSEVVKPLRRTAAALGIDARLELEQILFQIDGRLAQLEPYALESDVVRDIEGVRRVLLPPAVNPRELPTLTERFGSGLKGVAQHHGQRCSLWRGDITHIAAGAIVNAANSALLGCRVPHHACIDNAIHTAAGPRLRDACATLMAEQGHAEPVGAAKLTPAYALPSVFVVHTVGPQLARGSSPSSSDCTALASCYQACLEVAAEKREIQTIALCAISTGLFAFPSAIAATIALETVFRWLDANPERFQRIVFNVFTEKDEANYIEALT